MAARRVTLTFDNGPAPGVTENVLGALAERRIPAVFFVVGKPASTEAGRALVRRQVAEGHRVGSHTWTHSVLFGEGDDDVVRREIDDTLALVGELGGDPLLFRPYAAGGVMDARMMSPFGAQHLVDLGATCVSWTSVPGDWLSPQGWVDVALADVRSTDWSVVVLHDVPDAAAERLGIFLDALVSMGVEFRTDFPAGCVHIERGVPTPAFGALRVHETTRITP
jgi:peptidoglycan/xylan/chitin deacetylase (PgdA/CDA1 family)